MYKYIYTYIYICNFIVQEYTSTGQLKEWDWDWDKFILHNMRAYRNIFTALFRR